MILAFLYIILTLAASESPANTSTTAPEVAVEKTNGSASGSNQEAGKASVGGYQTVTFSASAESVATVPIPAKEVKTVTVSIIAPCTAQTSTSTTAKKETVCTKCYDKIINTRDCKKCATICDDGTKIETTNTSKNKCPKQKSEDVPCACKDPNGRVVEENFYKTSDTAGKSKLIDDSANLSN